MPNQFSMPFETPDSGAALCGLNSASGAGTGYPANPIVTLFLASHDATLVCLGEDYYELRYSISAPRFGDREIDIIDVVFPIAAQSDQDALKIVEVILAGHELPEFSPAQPVDKAFLE